LQDFNIKVIAEAENGLMLLKILKDLNPDVILLDIEMPKLDGSKTLDILAKEFPGTKTIILSQYDEETLIRDFFNRGARAYIPKNSKVEVICDAIKKVRDFGMYTDNVKKFIDPKELASRRGNYKLIYSRREREIIQLLCKGKTIHDISRVLCISEKTTETHLTEIYKKARVKGRAEFLIYAIQEGLNYLGSES